MTAATQIDATRARAEQHLRALVGPRDGQPDAVLYDDQWAAIEALVVDRRRALVVQRTGWGKSAVYFVATLLLREEGSGPTVIISPLLALMRNQIAAAERAGIRAVTINSTNIEQWEETHAAIQRGEVDVLLVSPERLNNPGFRDEVLPRLAATCGLLVVDEAHCISDWGHDFRPDYRRIRTLLAELPDGIPVLATTATANQRVTDDVAEQLVPTGSTTMGARAARQPRPRDAAPRRGPADDGRAATGVAGRPPGRAARQRHRLLPDRGRDPAGRRLPAIPRAPGRRLLRADRADRAARARAGAPRRRGQGAGRHQRARHGLRRLARLRGQPRRPQLAGGLLPAGGPGGPRHDERGVRRTPAGHRGPRHLGLLRVAGVPARGAGARDARRAGRGRRRDEHPGAGGAGRPQPQPARDDAQGARRRRRRTPRQRGLGGHRARSGPTTPTATAGWPRPASASSGRCSTT